jgi:hypothetical protein
MLALPGPWTGAIACAVGNSSRGSIRVGRDHEFAGFYRHLIASISCHLLECRSHGIRSLKLIEAKGLLGPIEAAGRW